LDADGRSAGVVPVASLLRAEARARELIAEQAGLRRVATVAARESSPQRVFAAVAEEVARILKVPLVSLVRYEYDGSATQLGGWRGSSDPLPLRTRWLLDDPGVVASVRQTGRPARIDDHRSAVAGPIVVEGRVWGAIVVLSAELEPLPEGTEPRLADFTELLAATIANAESRAELTTSRARVVATADETRRRIERDLHDGAQQRLVSLALVLRAAEAMVPKELQELRAHVAEVAEGLTSVLEELQEMSRGIHPPILSEDGLGPALQTLRRRSAVPVELEIRADRRLPESVEVAAYYVASEALANAAKHAHASVVHVDLEAQDGVVYLSIRDDGVGGAVPGLGSGLVGLRDRVEALGGAMEIESPAGGGTSLLVRMPCLSTG
jgi:signal transduction histidine kinase